MTTDVDLAVLVVFKVLRGQPHFALQMLVGIDPGLIADAIIALHPKDFIEASKRLMSAINAVGATAKTDC